MNRENQTRVVAIVDDIFFGSKIRETAKINGIELDFVRDSEQLIDTIQKDPPGLIIFDLNSKKLNPLELINLLKPIPELELTTMLGYFSHVDKELMKKAKEAGFDEVIPRSKFVRELGEILS